MQALRTRFKNITTEGKWGDISKAKLNVVSSSKIRRGKLWSEHNWVLCEKREIHGNKLTCLQRKVKVKSAYKQSGPLGRMLSVFL